MSQNPTAGDVSLDPVITPNPEPVDIKKKTAGGLVESKIDLITESEHQTPPDGSHFTYNNRTEYNTSTLPTWAKSLKK